MNSGHKTVNLPVLSLVLVAATLMLSGCGFFGGGKKDNVLVTSECPDLTVLTDDTFASTTKKLKEVADQYYLCKKAATATK